MPEQLNLTEKDALSQARNEFSHIALADIQDPRLRARAKVPMDAEYDSKVLRMRYALGLANADLECKL
jgi:hypothetical protein